MATIDAKLTTDPNDTSTKSIDSFEIVYFSGITSGEKFIKDLNASPGTTSWYVYEKNTKTYLPFSSNPYTVSALLEEIPESTTSEKISIFSASVSNLLNRKAIDYGYKSIDNAISYYNSEDTTKREEARSFSEWRDSVLFLAESNINGFTADGITLPDLNGFTSQNEYSDYSVFPIPTTFFGDEDAGYHITDLENRIFTAWINVDHQGVNSGLGQSIQIPFPSGNITDIYSISGIVDQGSQTSDWLNANYSLKVKFSGTANSYGVQTEFDYMIHSLDGYATTYNGLAPRFTIIGGY